ncbi:hypothetical protein VTO73DRAFT_4059 [Trametes versicolor]
MDNVADYTPGAGWPSGSDENVCQVSDVQIWMTWVRVRVGQSIHTGVDASISVPSSGYGLRTLRAAEVLERRVFCVPCLNAQGRPRSSPRVTTIRPMVLDIPPANFIVLIHHLVGADVQGNIMLLKSDMHQHTRVLAQPISSSSSPDLRKSATIASLYLPSQAKTLPSSFFTCTLRRPDRS